MPRSSYCISASAEIKCFHLAGCSLKQDIKREVKEWDVLCEVINSVLQNLQNLRNRKLKRFRSSEKLERFTSALLTQAYIIGKDG